MALCNTFTGARALADALASSCAVAGLAMAATLLPAAAHAETRSFRCGTDLVQLGDGKAEALLKCGEPLLRDVFCAPVAQGVPVLPRPGGPLRRNGPALEHDRGYFHGGAPSSACVTVDDWTYNPGRGQFLTTLRFASGRLVEIRYGDRIP